MQKYKISLSRFLVQLFVIVLIITGLMNKSILFTIALVTSILIGPIFCGWLCFFGIYQDWLNTVGKKLKIKQIEIPLKIHSLLRYLRYLILAGSITIGIIFLFPSEVRLSLLFAIKGNLEISLAFYIVIALGILSLFTTRLFCRYLCPIGAKYGLYSLFRPFTINKIDSCTSCKKCDKACLMNIKVSDYSSLSSPDCINCYKCIESCQAKSLNIGARKYMVSKSKKNLLLLITGILIAIPTISSTAKEALKMPKTKSTAVQKEASKSMKCPYCPRNCLIKSGDVGDCNKVKNMDGKLKQVN